MTHAVFLRLQVFVVVLVGLDLDGDVLHNLQSVGFQSHTLRGIVGQKAHLVDAEMAEHLRIDSSYLTRVIRLGYLSPYIVEKIAAGDLPHISLETLMKIQTPVWAEQHKALGID